MPSIVLIFVPLTWATGTRQLLTTSPSIKTEHAPHSPSPQPSLVPVNFNCSRNTSSSRSSGYASSVLPIPLTVQVMSIFCDTYPLFPLRLRIIPGQTERLRCQLSGRGFKSFHHCFRQQRHLIESN